MVSVKSAESMQDFGERVGRLLHGGELIELIGDVGAGKTTFVRGLARGVGVDETIQSPSFTINRVYDASNDLRLVHYDFYRLENAGIMRDELREAIDDKRNIIVIEWADAIEDVLPEDRLVIHIQAVAENERHITIDSLGHTLNLGGQFS